MKSLKCCIMAFYWRHCRDSWLTIKLCAGTRQSVLFLQHYGLTAVQAQRVVNQHGVNTETIVREDPFHVMQGGAVSFGCDGPRRLQLNQTWIVCAMHAAVCHLCSV